MQHPNINGSLSWAAQPDSAGVNSGTELPPSSAKLTSTTKSVVHPPNIDSNSSGVFQPNSTEEPPRRAAVTSKTDPEDLSQWWAAGTAVWGLVSIASLFVTAPLFMGLLTCVFVLGFIGYYSIFK